MELPYIELPYMLPLAYEDDGANGVLVAAAAGVAVVSAAGATGVLADAATGGEVEDTRRLPFLSQGLGGAACIKFCGSAMADSTALS